VIEFEFRLRFAPVSGEKILQVLPRLSSLPNYEPAGKADAGEAWIYRTRLPSRGELVAKTITAFDAIAQKSGATDRWFPLFSELSEWVRGNWRERSSDRVFQAWLTVDGDRRLFNFEKWGADETEGWPFVERVVSTLGLPVRLSPPSRDVTHTNGLQASLIGEPRGFACEVTGTDLSSMLQYFEKFARLVESGPRATSWSANLLPKSDAGAAYDALFAAELPVSTLSLSYEFRPPEPELLPRFHALCTTSKDSFTIPVGWFAAVPGLRGKLEIEINRKGLELNVVVEGELDENDELPSKGAFKELRASLPKLLDLPLTRK
jgi:hypothetical protein